MSQQKRKHKRKNMRVQDWQTDEKREPESEEVCERFPETDCNVKIGETVQRPVYKLEHPNDSDKDAQILTGNVIYIHPENRFYIVKFTLESGNSICESYSDCRKSA